MGIEIEYPPGFASSGDTLFRDTRQILIHYIVAQIYTADLWISAWVAMQNMTYIFANKCLTGD